MAKLTIKAKSGGYAVVDAKGALYFHGTLVAAEQYLAWNGKKKSVRSITRGSKGRVLTAKDILGS